MPNQTKSITCIICKRVNSATWWKCCPKHTTERGTDVVCQSCASECLSGKEIVIPIMTEKTVRKRSLNELQKEMIIKQQSGRYL